MKHYLVSDMLLLVGITGLALQNLVLRRRLRVDRLAREAEEALGPPRIGDIVMPDPSDPRWERKVIEYQDGKHVTFVLGHILVREDLAVTYIGAGDYIPEGKAYAKRVIRAYKRRLAEESRGPT